MVTYKKGDLPITGWAEYRKKPLTKAQRITGPFKIETTEGNLICEDGYLAIDSRGFPYPIDKEEFETIYEKTERTCKMDIKKRITERAKIRAEITDRLSKLGEKDTLLLISESIDDYIEHRIETDKILEGFYRSGFDTALLLISESLDNYIKHRIETDKILEGILKDIQGDIAGINIAQDKIDVIEEIKKCHPN